MSSLKCYQAQRCILTLQRRQQARLHICAMIKTFQAKSLLCQVFVAVRSANLRCRAMAAKIQRWWRHVTRKAVKRAKRHRKRQNKRRATAAKTIQGWWRLAGARLRQATSRRRLLATKQIQRWWRLRSKRASSPGDAPAAIPNRNGLVGEGPTESTSLPGSLEDSYSDVDDRPTDSGCQRPQVADVVSWMDEVLGRAYGVVLRIYEHKTKVCVLREEGPTERCSIPNRRLKLHMSTPETEKASLLARCGDVCCQCGALGYSVHLLKCSVCLVARYCSRDCQRTHWLRHKRICRPRLES